MKTGTKNKTRIIDIKEVRESLPSKIGEIDIEDFLEALPGLHAFTGCDSVSSLAGKGKVKAFNIVTKKDKYVQLFKLLGSECNVDDMIVELLEEFLCELYGYKDLKNINVLRYMIYCSKRGKRECEQLPPCRSSLVKHISRANSQTRIW